MKVLFINGSPNKGGKTAMLAKELAGEHMYETINLVDYKVYSYGQKFEDDQFAEILAKIKEAETIIVGSPVYWHNMSGALRTLLDRFFGPVEQNALKGRRLFFLFQGGSPTKEILEFGEYTMSRFAGIYGMDYMGMASNSEEVQELAKKF